MVTVSVPFFVPVGFVPVRSAHFLRTNMAKTRTKKGQASLTVTNRKHANLESHAADKPILQIEPKLKNLLPPLTEKELAGLEKDILARGVLSPLVVWKGILVDGHHRYQICMKHGLSFPSREIEFDNLEAAKFWAWSHQENRRNLSPYQRTEIMLQFKPVLVAKAKAKESARKSTSANSPESSKEIDTRSEVAKLAGVGENTVSRVEYISEHADESTKQKLRSGDTTINAEYKRLKKEKNRQEREVQKQAEVTISLDDRIHLFTADIAVAAQHVEAESVDFIVTDPPYPREFLPVYDDLAVFAQHSLKPGGSLLCMVGESYLPEIIEKLATKLKYHWTISYLTPGGQATQLFDRKVNTFWKPVLWFTKGDYGGDWIGDVAGSKANDNDKRHHHWGQSESGMHDLMERFLYPNMTVCDPFLGGGTTGLVALSLGCRFIGCDIDEDCVAKTNARLARSLAEGGPI